MGGNNSKFEDTIGWDNVKTDNMSANKIISKLSPEAINLIGLLNNVSNLSDTQSETNVKYFLEQANNNLSEEDKKNFKELFNHFALSDTEEEQQGGNSEEYLSETSPFISSEAYENMLGQNKLIGGAKIDNEDSSTSSTSTASEIDAIMSDDDEETLDDTFKKKKSKKYEKSSNSKTTKSSDSKSNNKTTESSDSKSNNKTTESSDDSSKLNSESQSAGSLDYISSSAHTDGDFSDDDSTFYKKNSDSVTDENSHLEASQYSVNTSDINFV